MSRLEIVCFFHDIMIMYIFNVSLIFVMYHFKSWRWQELRILIVEDEETIADIITTKLRAEKYVVDTSYDGEDGLYKANSNIYDLIILDIMLPKINGLEILKEIKENDINAKVILLTAKSELDDKLKGFDTGADDYVTKPFHMEELIARVNVQLRNKGKNKMKDILEYSDLTLNIRTSTLTCKRTNESINIPYREFLLLEYFMHNKEQIISKEQIYDKVWGIDTDYESNNLEAYLSFLRKKIKIIGSKVKIKAVRNLGYKMEE